MDDIKNGNKEEGNIHDGIMDISPEYLFKAGGIYYYPYAPLYEILPPIKRTIPRIEKSVEEK